MTTREMTDQTEIFTEALTVSVALGEITVDQLKLALEDGRAYVEAQGAENIAEELLVALAALESFIKTQANQPSGVEASDNGRVISMAYTFLDCGGLLMKRPVLARRRRLILRGLRPRP